MDMEKKSEKEQEKPSVNEIIQDGAEDAVERFKESPLYYRNWRYRNTAFLILSIIIMFFLAGTPFVRNLINSIGDLGYIGAFITGIFFVSTFTVAPAIVVLFSLAEHLNPWEVAILAGAGAVLGDYIIFRFVRDRLAGELKNLFMEAGGSYIARIFQTKYFAWLTPIIGAAIIASPLPDEAGVGILGVSRLRSWQFLLLSFVLNATGIFIVITIARLVH